MANPRLQVFLAPDILAYLDKRALNEGRKTGNLAAWILTQAVKKAMDEEKTAK